MTKQHKPRKSTRIYREACWNSLTVGTILKPLKPEMQGQAKQAKKLIYKDSMSQVGARLFVVNENGGLGGKSTMRLQKAIAWYGWEGKPSRETVLGKSAIAAKGRFMRVVADLSARLERMEHLIDFLAPQSALIEAAKHVPVGRQGKTNGKAEEENFLAGYQEG